MDYKLELVLIPVTDVDRAKSFYVDRAGFGLQVDTKINDNMRVVQVTPPGSACSIGFGTGITAAAPGSAQGLHLVVSDIVAARAELAGRQVEISEVRHLESGEWVQGPHPQRGNYESFADFADPDGNIWVVQEVNRDSGQSQGSK
ncbi:MAG TPA: VOC family protein [Streptosporangiaceae bacterium]|jgi:catechol 2,3-dioxygenase-like lactoylglutathione lyase family enzyme